MKTLRNRLWKCGSGRLTGERAGSGRPFVWKAHVVDDLLHLGLDPLLRETLQAAVEPDVLLHRQPVRGGGTLS